MGHLVPEFPDTQICESPPGGCLNDPVFGLSEAISTTLDEQVEGKRQAGDAVREDAVVDVAAGCVITGERRGLLPRFAAAAYVLVVAIREGLVTGNPKTLNEKKSEKYCRDALREVEVEASEAGKGAGHLVRHQIVSVYMSETEEPTIAGSSVFPGLIEPRWLYFRSPDYRVESSESHHVWVAFNRAKS